MNEREVHLKLSDVKIDNENLDYIKMTGEICGKLRDDLVKLFAIPDVSNNEVAVCGLGANPYCKFRNKKLECTSMGDCIHKAN